MIWFSILQIGYLGWEEQGSLGLRCPHGSAVGYRLAGSWLGAPLFSPKCLILPVSLSSPEQAGLAWSGVQVQVSISQPGKHKAEACRIPGGLPKPDAGTLSALAAFMGCVCVLSHI